MYAATTMEKGEPKGSDVPRGIGLHGTVLVSWAAAGGVLLGGILVAAMTLAGRLSGHGLFMTSSGLFVIGAVLGLLHGAPLGYLGREADVPGSRALRELGLAVLYAIPALAVAWLITVWVAMTIVARYLERMLPILGVAVGWALGATLVAVAAVKGARALRNAWARWPERRPAAVLVPAIFAALMVLFLADRPEVWFLRLRFTEVGAVLLAALLSVWVGVPMVTVGLRLRRELPGPQPNTGFGTGRRGMLDGAVGITAGLVLGLLAVPFAAPVVSAAGGPAGAVVHGVASALVDEVLLRLFLITSVAWLLLRWHRVHPEEAAVVSVVAVALVQLGLYLPGILAVGFPTGLAATSFALVVVLLPALVFGLLYWVRGFGTAVLADATAVGALALLAV